MSKASHNSQSALDACQTRSRAGFRLKETKLLYLPFASTQSIDDSKHSILSNRGNAIGRASTRLNITGIYLHMLLMSNKAQLSTSANFVSLQQTVGTRAAQGISDINAIVPSERHLSRCGERKLQTDRAHLLGGITLPLNAQ